MKILQSLSLELVSVETRFKEMNVKICVLKSKKNLAPKIAQNVFQNRSQPTSLSVPYFGSGAQKMGKWAKGAGAGS